MSIKTIADKYSFSVSVLEALNHKFGMTLEFHKDYSDAHKDAYKFTSKNLSSVAIFVP